MDDPSYDIWVFNESVSIGWAKNASLVFQMHHPAIWKNPDNRNDPNHYAWLCQPQGKLEIMMREQYAEVPNAVRFPLEKVCELTNGLKRGDEVVQYFTSSVAYALGLGVYRGYKDISIYGVELETNTEYQYQRENLNFWVGVALGKGCKINIPEQSGLFRALLYGYDGDISLPEQMFTERYALNIENRDSQKIAFQGAVEAARIRMEALNDATPENGQERAQAFADALAALCQAAFDVGIADGAAQEVERYMKRAETMKTASGDFLFSRQEFEQAAQSLTIQRDKSQANANWLGGKQNALFEVIGQTPATELETRKRLGVAYTKMLNAYIDAYIKFGVYHGAGKENMFFLDEIDKRIKAAGGAKSEAVFLAKAGGD